MLDAVAPGRAAGDMVRASLGVKGSIGIWGALGRLYSEGGVDVGKRGVSVMVPILKSWLERTLIEMKLSKSTFISSSNKSV